MGFGASHISYVSEIELLALCAHRELESGAGASRDFRAAAVKLARKRLINDSIRTDRKTLLHLALGQPGAVEFLLGKCKANASFPDADGFTPLHYFLLQGAVPQAYDKKKKPPEIIVLEALTRAQGLEVLTPDGRTAVHLAADNDDFVSLAALLQGGANPDAQDYSFKRTPLHICIEFVNSPAVKSLVVNLANPNLRDQLERTPIILAATVGDLDVLNSLLKSSKRAIPVKMNVKDLTGDTALITALRHQHEELVPLLVECKAQVNLPGARGESPLFVAVSFDLTNAVSHLISSEANLEWIGNSNRTALCQALRCYDSTDTLKVLLEASADLNVCEGCNHDEVDYRAVAPWSLWNEPPRCRAYGDPPIVLAAKSGDPASLQTLLDFNADPSDGDESECTPLMCVAALGHSDAAEVLRPTLLDGEVKRRDLYGWTARLHAAARGPLEAFFLSIANFQVLGEWWDHATDVPLAHRHKSSLSGAKRSSMTTQGARHSFNVGMVRHEAANYIQKVYRGWRTRLWMQATNIALPDGRQLYVNPKGWAGTAQWNTGINNNTNNAPGRNTWTHRANGTITLPDGQQLYVNPKGWAGVAPEGKHTNGDPARRTWTVNADGTIQLSNGQQLYSNKDGWVGVAHEGDHTNTESGRRTWIITQTSEGAAAQDRNAETISVPAKLQDQPIHQSLNPLAAGRSWAYLESSSRWEPPSSIEV